MYSLNKTVKCIKMTVKEQEFWAELSIRINTLPKSPYGYCDWIEPKIYNFNTPQTILEGKMGFLTPKMQVYKFVLTFPKADIDWGNILPFTLDNEQIQLYGDTLEINILE